MSLTSSAERPPSGVAYLSGADSPISSSSVATHSSDMLEGQMEVSGDATPFWCLSGHAVAMHQMSSVSKCQKHTISEAL